MDVEYEEYIKGLLEIRGSKDYSSLMSKFSTVTEHSIESIEQAIAGMDYLDVRTGEFKKLSRDLAVTGLLFRGKYNAFPVVTYKCMLNGVNGIEHREIPLWEIGLDDKGVLTQREKNKTEKRKSFYQRLERDGCNTTKLRRSLAQRANSENLDERVGTRDVELMGYNREIGIAFYKIKDGPIMRSKIMDASFYE